MNQVTTITPAAQVTEHSVFFARPPGKKGAQKLRARIILPTVGTAPHPLLIWMHSGGFRTGTIDHPNHTEMATEFARYGVAMAFIEYRLKTPLQNLSKQSQNLQPRLDAISAQGDFGMPDGLSGTAALAAAEDCILFLLWLAKHGASHGLGGELMLGGSSAGAITVLNTLFLAPHLGIKLPRISTAFVMSGAFVYPELYAPTPTRILAQHRESDRKVPIASIRHFAEIAASQCTLQEHLDHPHGGLKLTPREPLANAVNRLMQFAWGPSWGPTR